MTWRSDRLGATLIAVPVAVVLFPLAGQPLLLGPLAAALLLAHRWAEGGEERARAVAWGLSLAVVGALAARLLALTLANVENPPQWDFRWFWLHGRVAAMGLNVYEPEHARALAAAFQNTPDFIPELFFFYPPPTLFLVAPLGAFDIQTAAAAWGAFHLAVLIADVWLIWRLFLADRAELGLLLSGALLLVLRATQSTVEYAQTNFLVLLFVLLAWRTMGRPITGAWLAVGAVVKPIVAFVGLFLLVRRRWSALAAAIGTGIVLVAVSALVFGVETVRTYFVSNPAGNAVGSLFTQPINQSMMAIVLRFTEPDAASPLLSPFALGAAMVVAATAILVTFNRDLVPESLALALFVPTALLLYPSSLAHYAVLLIVPLAYLVSRQQAVSWGWMAVTVLTAVSAALSGSRFSFVAVLLVWVALVALAGWLQLASRRELRPPLSVATHGSRGRRTTNLADLLR